MPGCARRPRSGRRSLGWQTSSRSDVAWALPGFTLVAPSGVPAPILEKISADIRAVVTSSDVGWPLAVPSPSVLSDHPPSAGGGREKDRHETEQAESEFDPPRARRRLSVR